MRAHQQQCKHQHQHTHAHADTHRHRHTQTHTHTDTDTLAQTRVCQLELRDFLWGRGPAVCPPIGAEVLLLFLLHACRTRMRRRTRRRFRSFGTSSPAASSRRRRRRTPRAAPPPAPRAWATRAASRASCPSRWRHNTSPSRVPRFWQRSRSRTSAFPSVVFEVVAAPAVSPGRRGKVSTSWPCQKPSSTPRGSDILRPVTVMWLFLRLLCARQVTLTPTRTPMHKGTHSAHASRTMVLFCVIHGH